MAGIIEKMSVSTDLIGLEVGATSSVPEGFEACLANQTTLDESQGKVAVVAESMASETRQSPEAAQLKLSKSLTHSTDDERSESSVATSDAALLIKSLGAMIEPEAKPVAVGLEALGKVIALRTGKSAAGQEASSATTVPTPAGSTQAVDHESTLPTGPLTMSLSAASNQGSIAQSLTKSTDAKETALTTPITDTTVRVQAGEEGAEALAKSIQSGESARPLTMGSLTELDSAETQSLKPTLKHETKLDSATPTALSHLKTVTAHEQASQPGKAQSPQPLESAPSVSMSTGGSESHVEVEAALKTLKEVPSGTRNTLVGASDALTDSKAMTSAPIAASIGEQGGASMRSDTRVNPEAMTAAAPKVVAPSAVKTTETIDRHSPVVDAPNRALSSKTVSSNPLSQQPLNSTTESAPKGSAETVSTTTTRDSRVQPTLAGSAAAPDSVKQTSPQASAATLNAQSKEMAEPTRAGSSETALKSAGSGAATANRVAAETAGSLRGMKQSTKLRSRLEPVNRPESTRSAPQTSVGVREVVSQASKLVRPTKAEHRPEQRQSPVRPSLGASERVKVLGKALRAEVVDMEVSKGPRELSVARNSMRLRARSASVPTPAMSPRLGSSTGVQQLSTPSDPVAPTGLNSAHQVNQADSGAFKLRFAENATIASSASETELSEMRTASEATRTGQVKTVLKDTKVSTLPLDATAPRSRADVDAEGRPTVGQEGQQNPGGRKEGQNQRTTQATPSATTTIDQSNASETTFADAVESATSNPEEADEAVLRARSETRSVTQSGRQVERSFGGRTSQTSNQAQVQATMRQDLLHRLSASEFPGHVSNLVFRNQEQARLQLHPAELGRMNLELQVKAGEVQMKVAVESAAAAAEIQGQLSQLKDQLQSQGLRLGDVSVDVSQKEFEADGQSMNDSGDRGQGSERDQEAQRAEEEQAAINKTKKRKKSADGRLDVIA